MLARGVLLVRGVFDDNQKLIPFLMEKAYIYLPGGLVRMTIAKIPATVRSLDHNCFD